MNVHLIGFVMILVVCTTLVGQDRRPSGKPVLIRDEVNKKDEIDEEKIPIHDPVQAKKSVGIGDFYFKRQNYSAAEQRYREAIDFNVHWSQPYEKLIKVLEKREEWESAIQVCALFVQENPESKDVEKFQKKIRQLEQKAEKDR